MSKQRWKNDHFQKEQKKKKKKKNSFQIEYTEFKVLTAISESSSLYSPF